MYFILHDVPQLVPSNLGDKVWTNLTETSSTAQVIGYLTLKITLLRLIWARILIFFFNCL